MDHRAKIPRMRRDTQLPIGILPFIIVLLSLSIALPSKVAFRGLLITLKSYHIHPNPLQARSSKTRPMKTPQPNSPGRQWMTQRIAFNQVHNSYYLRRPKKMIPLCQYQDQYPSQPLVPNKSIAACKLTDVNHIVPTYFHPHTGVIIPSNSLLSRSPPPSPHVTRTPALQNQTLKDDRLVDEPLAIVAVKNNQHEETNEFSQQTHAFPARGSALMWGSDKSFGPDRYHPPQDTASAVEMEGDFRISLANSICLFLSSAVPLEEQATNAAARHHHHQPPPPPPPPPRPPPPPPRNRHCSTLQKPTKQLVGGERRRLLHIINERNRRHNHRFLYSELYKFVSGSEQGVRWTRREILARTTERLEQLIDDNNSLKEQLMRLTYSFIVQ